MTVQLSFDPKKRLPFAERFARFLATNPDPKVCWEWMGSRSKEGYGQTRFMERSVHVHLAAYRIVVGEVPKGLELDHLCRNEPCFNPAHLEPVTRLVNMQRRTAIKTHCPNGHEWTPENTRILPRSDGKPGTVRWCNECGRIRGRDYWRRKGAKAHRSLDSTICAQGHDMTVVGIYTDPKGRHRPECMECRRAYSQRARDKKRQKT